MAPLVVSIVPPPAASVIPLFAFRVCPLLLTYVPLSKVKKFATGDAAAPLLVSLLAFSHRLPPVTSHFPFVNVAELFALGLKSPPPVIVTVLPTVLVIVEAALNEPDAILNVPPELTILIPRVLLIVRLAVVFNVPPLNESWSPTAEPGAAPRFPSELTLSVPALIKVLPEYVFAALRTGVPAPACVNVPVPEIAPPLKSVPWVIVLLRLKIKLLLFMMALEVES